MIQDIEIASVAGDDTQANRDSASGLSSLSADGRMVAFQTTAGNLVAGGTNGYGHVFVKDTETGAITHVSTDSSGVQANHFSYATSISADGRQVSFSTTATNLAGGHVNGYSDVFVKDLATGALVNAATDANGVIANWNSYGGSLSADGRYVAFESYANNLVAGPTNWADKVFVKDLVTGSIVNASTSDTGVLANAHSWGAALSGDAQFVAFTSDASNLVAGDTNGARDVFVKNVATGAIARVSTAADGAQGSGQSVATDISGDGRFVVFESTAGNLVAGDGNGVLDVFVKDTVTGALVRVSTDASGAEGNGRSSGATISADGRYVTFMSEASNLVPADTNGRADVFMKDLATGSIVMLSTNAQGAMGNGTFGGASLSADGRHVAYFSNANNLVAGDANGVYDVFVASLNSAPSLAPGELPIAENETLVGRVLASDADGDTLTYTITGGADAGLFTIDAATGEVSFLAAPDFEAPADSDLDNRYELVVEASDGYGGSTSATLRVVVQDVHGVSIIGREVSDTLAGTSESDAVNGKAGDDTIAAGDGDDVVYGGAGHDTIVAGHGHQTLNGGTGYDTLDFRGLDGDLSVVTGQHTASNSGSGLDAYISGFEHILGNGGNGRYTGSAAAEHFEVTGNGANWFRGMGGADVFTGGEGADTFVFLKKDIAAGSSVITNFEVGEDHLELADFLKGNFIKNATYDQVLGLVDVANADGSHDTLVRGKVAGVWTDVVRLDGIDAATISVHDLLA
jgi:hypothetical protein